MFDSAEDLVAHDAVGACTIPGQAVAAASGPDVGETTAYEARVAGWRLNSEGKANITVEGKGSVTVMGTMSEGAAAAVALPVAAVSTAAAAAAAVGAAAAGAVGLY